MANIQQDDLVARFERREIDAASFGHREHVAAAFAMLCKYPFLDATRRYGEIIRQVATNAGAAGKFNVTITLAFMALIAERMQSRPGADWPEFIERNPDLLSRSLLERWYSRERLGSALARSQFLLPDRSPAS